MTPGLHRKTVLQLQDPTDQAQQVHLDLLRFDF